MKNMIKYAGFVLAAGLLSSCEDFLTEDPQSIYTTDIFYTSQSDIEYAVSAIYAAQQDAYDGQYGMFRFLSARSDDTNSVNTNMYDNGAATFIDNANVEATEQMWKYMYQIISRANTLLTHIDAIEFTNADLKKYIKGEAYALRGWAFYNLGTWFGGVPLTIDKEYTVEEARETGRSTQEETFNQAVSDYTNAIGLLPDSWDANNVGRVTKYAAEAALGRLYMFTGDYTKAKEHLWNVIDSDLYDMADTYEQCFAGAYDNSSERVWEVQYIGGLLNEGQTFSESCMPENYQPQEGETKWAYFSGSSAAMQVSTNLLNSYEPTDKRKDVTAVTGITVAGVVNEYSWFTKFSRPGSIPMSETDWDVNLPIIRYTDVLMMYAEAVNQLSGPTQEAIDIINDVRERAGLANLSSNATSSREAFQEAIEKERRAEFAFEGLRWHDLVRWGKAVDVMNKFFKDSDEGNGLYSCKEHQIIFAIPQEEINRYGDEKKMYQNPGY